ncbi:hypothetical protein [Enterococcus gilvus]|uniref:hypothetical protein n=1 Tax=Enterococcus gilvus TaxID=160453 RepID=UPI00290B6637|nr:hypothetical protein [Enterococcus gilvus]MDU5511289.1 hypothetical protein [Enterococcus gilvus]
MLEALEKIKSTEKQNEKEKETLMSKLADYESSQRKMLQEKREALKKDFSKALSEREHELAEKLTVEEQELASNAKGTLTTMEDNYLKKKEQTIQRIIEGVISEYGSQ